jgi:hypothetical protein
MGRLIGICSFYDESPTWLAACVAAAAKCCDHFVACDGSYQLFPQASGKSPLDQAEAILRTADAVNMPVTLYRQEEPFWENEVGKRNLSLRLAEAVAEPMEDWYIILDADEVVSYVSPDFKARLFATDKHVATWGILNRLPDPKLDDFRAQYTRAVHEPAPAAAPIRALYRAIPGLEYVGAHYVVNPLHRLSPAEELHTALIVDHYSADRDLARAERAREYYRTRDLVGIEKLGKVMVEGLDGQPVEVVAA